jgi:signal transduction histidine kinase/CheY-like chemotaxis protein
MAATRHHNDDYDLRLPIHYVIAALAVCGVGIGLAEQATAAPLVPIALSLLTITVAGLAWLLQAVWPPAAPWGMVAGIIGVLHLAAVWLHMPALLTLAPLVVGLSAALVGLRAAAVTAAAITAWLALLGARGPFHDPTLVSATMGGAWAMLALMVGIYTPLRQRLRASAEFIATAQAQSQRAQARQVELAQALDNAAHLNRQLVLTTQKLDQAREAAEAAQKLKADFVARVSHELRTPLNMIVGFAEMMMEAPTTYGGDIPQALLADLSVILRNSQHLSSLIDDVLDLSRIDAGQMAITRERASIAMIIESAAEVVKPLFHSKGLTLDIDIPPDLPLIFCDPTRIREAVVNLLSNAGRFTEEGGVDIAVRQEATDVIIAVTDTGPGIDPAMGKELFQPFRQLEDTIRRRHNGTGLGLAISRSFVEQHGGRIWFESELQRGTTFYFRLPTDPPMPVDDTVMRWLEPTWEYRVRLTRPQPPADDAQLRLVVLESGSGLTRLLTRYLDNAELVRVETLEEARQRLAHTPAQALLVNALSVGEALQRVVDSGLTALDTPVIVCSVPDIGETTGRMGVEDYLLKPISRRQLQAVLDDLGLDGKTVLVVDDEPEELRLFWRMLGSAGRGYRILTAADGQEALAIMRDQRPDAVLLDLVMPNMDGFELLKVREADETLRGIPIVVITALDPTAQPIVSSSLAVTQGQGLSVPQFLNCVEGLSRLLAAGVGRNARSERRGRPADPAD